MEENTQALDQELLHTEQKNPDENLASQGKRFANMLIDVVCYYVLAFIVVFILMLIGVFDDEPSKAVSYLITFSSMWLYFTVMEASFGKTVGKLVTKTRVVDEEGNSLDFGKATVRSLCRLIPFDAFSYLSSRPVGWHDSISRTRVINDLPFQS